MFINERYKHFKHPIQFSIFMMFLAFDGAQGTDNAKFEAEIECSPCLIRRGMMQNAA
jgi:hypothetical protein